MLSRKQMNFVLKKPSDQNRNLIEQQNAQNDLVLVKKKGFVSKPKIADKWETELYLDQMSYQFTLL